MGRLSSPSVSVRQAKKHIKPVKNAALWLLRVRIHNAAILFDDVAAAVDSVAAAAAAAAAASSSLSANDAAF